MKTPSAFTKAFTALQALGAPVTLKPDWFVISGEDNHNGTLWAYSDEDYMHPSIEAILSANGLAYEWYDSGTAQIHTA